MDEPTRLIDRNRWTPAVGINDCPLWVHPDLQGPHTTIVLTRSPPFCGACAPVFGARPRTSLSTFYRRWLLAVAPPTRRTSRAFPSKLWARTSVTFTRREVSTARDGAAPPSRRSEARPRFCALGYSMPGHGWRDTGHTVVRACPHAWCQSM